MSNSGTSIEENGSKKLRKGKEIKVVQNDKAAKNCLEKYFKDEVMYLKLSTFELLPDMLKNAEGKKTEYNIADLENGSKKTALPISKQKWISFSNKNQQKFNSKNKNKNDGSAR